jgi:hypothetical protein
MHSQKLTLRCYAEQESESLWIAVCIDLCLAAQGESYCEARKRLDRQIDSYIFDAIDGEDQRDADQLLHRKAPFKQQLKYHLIRLHLSGLLFQHKTCNFMRLTPRTHAV